MLRSMFAAVSGLRSHQTMMDVVGTNISNVNTTGFKASRTTFQDAMSQVIRGASGVQDDRAGTNAMQIGLGSQVSSIDSVFTQGSIQLTSRNTDIAIQGEGFLVADIGGQRMYTRSGALNVDSSGTLTGPGGSRIMGWMSDDVGDVDTQQDLTALSLPTGQVIAPVESSEIVVGGNLPATAATGDVVNTSITVYDQQGIAISVALQFQKTATANEWELFYDQNEDGTFAAGESVGDVVFAADGTLDTALTTVTQIDVQGTGQMVDIQLQEAGIEIVQFGDATTAEARSQDGNEMGFLRGFDFGADGSITGRFSNGQTKVLGVIAVATFTNPGGLQRQGESMFTATLNSGGALVARPGEGDGGQLAPGSLEMSNVELAQEFTNLIIAQRGFQANARSITASDELLADIVNLKR
jgi:flagellar hook protein FlgE